MAMCFGMVQVRETEDANLLGRLGPFRPTKNRMIYSITRSGTTRKDLVLQ